MLKIKQLIEPLENRGQSLVETALFLPILIFMLLGIVEVGNLLVTQNRLTSSSRQAAGFGAANFDHTNWANDTSGTAHDMGVVAITTISDSMPVNTDLWDIYSVHGLTAPDGESFEVFESAWVYGTHNVVGAAEWATMLGEIETHILDSLQESCPDDPASCAGHVEFVASVPFHNLDTILGIPIWQWVGFQRVRGLTVMRVRPVIEAAGCAILPIAVRLNQYSLYPTGWDDPDVYDPPGTYLQYSDDPVDPFPEPDEFSLPNRTARNPDDPNGPGSNDPANPHPPPVPVYELVPGAAPPQLDTVTYPRNVPGIPLWQAISEDDKYSGALFWMRDFTENGNFGWLSWGGETDEGTLVSALIPGPPGDFIDKYPGSRADTSMDGGTPFQTSFGEDTGNGDGWLQPGEWVEGATGNMREQAERALYYPYVKEGREVGVLVFTRVDSGSGSNRLYQAFDFITVRVVGFDFGGAPDQKWIIFEFVSSDLVCGTEETS